MATLKLMLVTGRSTKQGAGISSGKEYLDYQEATRILDVNTVDLERSGLAEGDAVRITTEYGSAEVICRAADIPPGMAFIAFGPACNRLVGGETYASGMPDSKHVEIEITRAVPKNQEQKPGSGIMES